MNSQLLFHSTEEDDQDRITPLPTWIPTLFIKHMLEQLMDLFQRETIRSDHQMLILSYFYFLMNGLSKVYTTPLCLIENWCRWSQEESQRPRKRANRPLQFPQVCLCLHRRWAPVKSAVRLSKPSADTRPTYDLLNTRSEGWRAEARRKITRRGASDVQRSEEALPLGVNPPLGLIAGVSPLMDSLVSLKRGCVRCLCIVSGSASSRRCSARPPV